MVAMLGLLALGGGVVQAGQVVLILPDETIRRTIEEVAKWYHAESDANGGYKTEAQKIQWIADFLIQTVSIGHYQSLKELGGTLAIHYDAP